MKIKGVKVKAVSLVVAAAAVVGALIGFFMPDSVMLTSAEVRRIPIYAVETKKKQVALTFDAAWGNSDTDALIALLELRQVKATFFVTGDWCDRYPDDVKKLAAAGHAIGNHSDRHPHPNALTTAKLIADTECCSDKIEKLTGIRPTLYRAPYGEYNTAVVRAIEDDLGMRMIQWDADSLDWKRCGASAAVQNVMNKVQNGSILLFHNDIDTTVESVETVILRLQAQGYEFVTVGELIDPENYDLDNSGRQRLSE